VEHLPAIAADPSKDQSTTDKVKEKAAETWDKTKEKTSEAWDKTKEKTVETKDKVKDKIGGNKKESAEDKAEAARKAEGKDTVGAKVDRGLDKTKAKARDTKDKIAAKTESSDDVRQAQTALKEKGQDPGRSTASTGRARRGAPQLPEDREHQGDRPSRQRDQGPPDGRPGVFDDGRAVGLTDDGPDAGAARGDRFALRAPGGAGEDADEVMWHRGAGGHTPGPRDVARAGLCRATG